MLGFKQVRCAYHRKIRLSVTGLIYIQRRRFLSAWLNTLLLAFYSILFQKNKDAIEYEIVQD
jgi:hypothetical protein